MITITNNSHLAPPDNRRQNVTRQPSPLQLPHDAVSQRHAFLQVQHLWPRRLLGAGPLGAVDAAPVPPPRGALVRRALRPGVVTPCRADLGGLVAIGLVDLIQGILFGTGHRTNDDNDDDDNRGM